MSYDNTCKFLAETYPADFATWLLGAPVPLTLLDPTELSTEPLRADSLILFESDERILQMEFQTLPKPEVPFRMADYRLRIYRRFPNKRLIQVVIYLRPTQSPLVQQTQFEIEGLQAEFQVIRLWEQPTQLFLNSPGLLPLAVLTQTSNRVQVLQQVAQIQNRRQQQNVMASVATLAGLVLEERVIRQFMREDVMRESVMVQSWLAEGEAKGEAEGKMKATTQIAINLLREGLDPQVVARNTGLSPEQLQQLQEQIDDE